MPSGEGMKVIGISVCELLEGDEAGGGVCEFLCRCVVGARGDSLRIWRFGTMWGIRGRETEGE